MRSAKNDDSLVLRLHYGDQTLLLPGDAEKQAEREILSENGMEAMRSRVLKIGHHRKRISGRLQNCARRCDRSWESFPRVKIILTDILVQSYLNDWKMRACGS